MSYDKYTWQTGEVITAAKLNHIEDGIAAIGSVQYTIELPASEGGSPVFKAPNNAVKAGDTGVMTYPDGSQDCYIVTNTYPTVDNHQTLVTLTADYSDTLQVIAEEWVYSDEDEGFIIPQNEPGD